MTLRTALVTGAGGFVGFHLARRLADSGWHVRALDVHRTPVGLPMAGLQYVEADVRDARAVGAALRGVDTVFHLASVHLAVRAATREFEDVNVRATGELVRQAAAAGVRRFIHTSSVGIYGHLEDPPADESAPRRPTTPYEQTKLAGETAALEEAGRVGLGLVVLRPAWVFGPRCPRTARLLRTVRKGRFFYVGDGANLRHPLYVDDMVAAFLLAADAPTVEGQAYIVAGPRYMELREMVETCARVLGVHPPRLSVPKPLGHVLGLACELAFGVAGKEPPFSRRSLAFFEHDNAFVIEAARRELGFEPRVDFEEGMRQTLAAMSGPFPRREARAVTAEGWGPQTADGSGEQCGPRSPDDGGMF